MKINRHLIKRAIGVTAASAAVTLLAVSGLFASADLSLSDIWYREKIAGDGTIVLVGIDQKALEDIGPYGSWGRDVIARVLENLNQSEECRPAVIGLDILYVGESTPEADEWLVQAAGAYGNVVTASAAEFGTGIREEEDGTVYIDDFFISAYEEPFTELKAVTTQGHINAMFDRDGILRHCLWELNLEDGRTVPSFACAISNLYREYTGEEPVEKPPVDKRGFWYLPFSGGPGDFSESISVADVLSKEVPPEYFAGKIVLIGPYTVGLQDSYVTAVSHARNMYGVEYQANAIAALLRGDYKKEVPDNLQFVLLFVILLVAASLFWNRSVITDTVIWAVVTGGYLLACKWMYRHGLILQVTWVPLGMTVFYVGGIAANYIASAVEKLRVTNTFKRYVAPQIVNEVLREEEEGTSEGRVVDIAVLFVDVRGFTAMSEALPPSEVVAILNRYLTLVADCIIRYDGTLDKFIGDAAMAFWGAPNPQEDYVMNAVRAAEAMRQGAAALSEELLKAYGRTVSFGIGIHVGEAVVGNIGSPQRMDYTAIGDTVNTASRLESNAPAGTIYISREVADRLKGRIETTSLGTAIHLKGKTDGFEILTLDGICGEKNSENSKKNNMNTK